MMLPQLEQSSLYNATNFSQSATLWENLDGMNSTVQLTTVNAFLCPSDSNRMTFSPAFGANNYVANAGADANSFRSGSPDVSPAGYVAGSTTTNSGPYASIGLVTKIAQITDGTSNTVGFSEIVKGIGTSAANYDGLRPSSSLVAAGVAPSGGTTSAGVLTVGNPQTDYNNCYSKPLTPASATAAAGWPMGAVWWWARSGQTRYCHVMPPNTWGCDFGGNSDSDSDAITATSRHSGGVNCAMVDGSVRFVKSSINPATWWALATMAGGEVVSADAY
jgi:prepilin-type processing-associated H-X9-DG protein